MALAIYFCIIAASVTQSAAAKLYNGKNTDPDVFCFNALKAASAVVLFAFAALLGGFQLHIPTVLYGMFYGLSLCLSMHAGYRALCLGPMALTSMLVSFSLIIPLAWGVLFGDERVGVLQWVAFGCLLVSMVVVNADKLKANGRQENGHALWLVFVTLTFLPYCVCSILQKEHQRAFPGQFGSEFVLLAMLICGAIYMIAAIARTPKGAFGKIRGKRYAVLSGTTNALANFLTLSLAGFENASILFPVISAGTILGSLLCGRLVFGEKLKTNHYIAILFGTASVVLLKL